LRISTAPKRLGICHGEGRAMRRLVVILLMVAAILLGVLGTASVAVAHEPPGCEIAHEAAANASHTAHEHICADV
jgi:hypothetical protein